MRRLLIAVLIFFVANSAFSEDWKTFTNEELYQLGIKSLNEEDWLGAVKYLFAYQVRVEPIRNTMNVEDRIKLLNNIAEAEKWLRTKQISAAPRISPSRKPTEMPNISIRTDGSGMMGPKHPQSIVEPDIRKQTEGRGILGPKSLR